MHLWSTPPPIWNQMKSLNFPNNTIQGHLAISADRKHERYMPIDQKHSLSLSLSVLLTSMLWQEAFPVAKGAQSYRHTSLCTTVQVLFQPLLHILWFLSEPSAHPRTLNEWWIVYTATPSATNHKLYMLTHRPDISKQQHRLSLRFNRVMIQVAAFMHPCLAPTGPPQEERKGGLTRVDYEEGGGTARAHHAATRRARNGNVVLQTTEGESER